MNRRALLPAFLLLFLFLPVPASGQAPGDSVRVPYPEDKNCTDFSTQMEALEAYGYARRVTGEENYHRIDGDGDGQPCEGIQYLKTERTSDSTSYDLTGQIERIVCPDTTVDLSEFHDQIDQGIRDRQFEEGFGRAASCVGLHGGVDTDTLLSAGPEEPGSPKSLSSYADSCATTVDNATVHVPNEAASLTPAGEPPANGDTLLVKSYATTGGLRCSGFGTWADEGTTLAAAGTDEFTDGYVSGENVKLYIYDVSQGEEYALAPEWAPPDSNDVNDIWAEGVYEDDTFNKVDTLHTEPAL